MNIEIYADGCNKKSIRNYSKGSLIKGSQQIYQYLKMLK